MKVSEILSEIVSCAEVIARNTEMMSNHDDGIENISGYYYQKCQEDIEKTIVKLFEKANQCDLCRHKALDMRGGKWMKKIRLNN